MSQNEILSKSQKKRQKQAEKRKASSSPLADISGHYTPGQTADSPSVTCSDYLQHSKDYVSAVMNPNTSPMVNYNQQFPYSLQTIPTPGTPSVFPPGTPGTPLPTGTPAWALPLIEDIKAIKSALPKIDMIEKTVNSMSIKFSEMDIKVTELESKVNDIEKSVSFIDNHFESQKEDIKQHKNEIKKMQQLCSNMQETIYQQQKREEINNDKLLDLEFRSMRDNLIFYGLQEPPTKPSTPSKTMEPQKFDNCEELVKTFISDTLDIDTKDMEFNRIHRLGGKQAKKPRPIIVNFHRYSDREKVRQKSYEEEIKEKLKQLKQGVGTQQPQQYRDARKALSECAKTEEELGKKTRIVGNKLYVNNSLKKKYVDGKIYETNKTEI